MKYILKRNSTNRIEDSSKWEVRELILNETELIDYLKYCLTNVMEGILDPDIAGKKPDRFLENLQSGKLGDYSQRYIITALDNNKVIGLLIGLLEEERLHIYSMGVLPQYRGMGVGSALLTKCINDMLEKDVHEIKLDVHSNNIPAYNFYKKFDFR